ncbi:MAG TPA: isoleucine--tRNA ligase [Oligoflexia bacterium]|mgnify:CR=1 FL=1|nr:isoleucine--tRNA ligase [Oligoflexia bacterium]HMP48257.1 isoleucine--tRNA ligase [Oligoflexia bacterium]
MKAVTAEVSFPDLEKEILDFWRDKKIFKKSMDPELGSDQSSSKGLASSGKRPEYIFYDGPPFATGLPHYGHLLAGTIKDVIGRYFTMKGFRVDRRFGWDCHGVPVEMEIQKNLNLNGSKAIREFGIDNFNEACRSIVDRYSKEWVSFVERSGRWVDFEREYRTMDINFMESVWWAVKSLWDRGLIYEGFKCVSYSPAMSTPISNFEANLNYKQVQDPSVTVRGRVIGDVSVLGHLPQPLSFYVWTTTPWTLPSNTALAINSNLEYSLVRATDPDEYVIIAKNKAEDFFSLHDSESGKEKKKTKKAPTREAEIVKTFPGSELLGVSYEPFFPFFESHREDGAFKVFHGDFVSDEDGTGVVHLASFGEDDLGLFMANGLPVIDPLNADGCFENNMGFISGLYFKDADPKIIQELKSNKLLVQHETIEHSYPFCWRTDSPLIYKSISTWFVKVEAIKESLISANQRINWVPEHLKDGRFGKWLENVRDWSISRNRFWGTPIPIWRSESGRMMCIGSVEELEKLSGRKITDLHTHFIDEISFPCPETGEIMHRVPEILDCWFESGAMPYAQAHYPFDNQEEFDANFPADFIAEGLDQTRGWFYTLLVLSSALFKKPAFKNVIVNGIILAEDGRKMSKSLRNYPPADEVMNKYGADALRLYLLASAATKAEELRFSEIGVKDVVRQTLIPLWNAYKFLVTYAEVDSWDPSKRSLEPSPNLLDRWILSRLLTLSDSVDRVLGSYRLYAAAPLILDFIDQLTNWYIRLNRRRFWLDSTEAERRDKNFAYTTLYEVLSTFSRIIAPLAPFISEEIYRNLSDVCSEPNSSPVSVHLQSFPGAADLKNVESDKSLEESMELFEETILLGRALRHEHDLKLRQPLAKITIVYGDPAALSSLKKLDGYIREELNVKIVEYVAEEEQFVSLAARLNTIKLGKTLGPKLGKDGMGRLNAFISGLGNDQLRKIESGGGCEFEGEVFSRDDILISRKPKEGLTTAASSGRITVVLDTALTQELRLEGLAREFVNRVQKLRKDFNFEITDRIMVRYMTACPKISHAVKEHRDYIMSETLAIDLEAVGDRQEFFDIGADEDNLSVQEIDGSNLVVLLQRTQA